jgi:hypothetical protein
MISFEEFKVQATTAMQTLRNLEAAATSDNATARDGDWVTALEAYNKLREQSFAYKGEGQPEELDQIMEDVDTIQMRYWHARGVEVEIAYDSGTG